MLYSKLFTKTQKFAPSDEVSKNAELLIRAGYIYKEMSGVYDLLPLGLRVMKNIEKIIQEEMDGIDGQEIELSTLQNREAWEPTGRWDEDEIWFKTALNNGTELGLGFTHEEPLTKLMTEHIHSYRDLPQYPYQIQTKFRNELRSKSGMIRGREFLMKDMYSFSKDEEEHMEFYEKSKLAYMRIFDRVGLGEHTFITFSSGGSFSKYSHEFQTISDAGEDIIYLDRDKKMAVNKEVYTDETLAELDLDKDSLEEIKSIEVGNIFSLGTKFSEPIGLKYEDEKGESNPVIMGSYGIGLGRIMGTVVEVFSDEHGIIWPKSIAPFQAYLIGIGDSGEKKAQEIYDDLIEKGIEIFWDDRDGVSIGEKFADADLLGIPTRIVVSDKTLENDSVEIKDRKTGEEKNINLEKVYDELMEK